MNAFAVRVRFAPRVINLVAGVPMGLAVTMLIIGLASGTPVYILSAPLLIASIVIWALLTGGVLPCLVVTTWEVANYSILLNSFVPPRWRYPLAPGDALVVTSEALFIWWFWGKRYKQVDVDPRWANSQDWARLRDWAASIWPQPPEYTHRSSIIE